MKKIILISILVILLIIISSIIYFKTNFINKNEVERIILEDMSIKKDEISLYESNLELDGKTFIYEVSFIYNNKEYEYIINAKTGNIIKSKIDKD